MGSIKHIFDLYMINSIKNRTNLFHNILKLLYWNFQFSHNICLVYYLLNLSKNRNITHHGTAMYPSKREHIDGMNIIQCMIEMMKYNKAF